MSNIAEVISYGLLFLILAIFGRAIVSWLIVSGSSSEVLFRLAKALDNITTPILAPLRRVVPTVGMLDLTPMIAIIILTLLRRALAGVY